MEFTGRIAKLLPIRQGVSQRTGNEWKSLPFIFEYFEHESDRYAEPSLMTYASTRSRVCARHKISSHSRRSVRRWHNSPRRNSKPLTQPHFRHR